MDEGVTIQLRCTTPDIALYMISLWAALNIDQLLMLGDDGGYWATPVTALKNLPDALDYLAARIRDILDQDIYIIGDEVTFTPDGLVLIRHFMMIADPEFKSIALETKAN
jgi:hypothetical protein